MAVGFMEGEIDEVNDGGDFMRLWFAKGVVAHARYHNMMLMLVC